MSTAEASVASAQRDPNRWAVLALLSVAQLHFSTGSRQWIVTAYARRGTLSGDEDQQRLDSC